MLHQRYPRDELERLLLPRAAYHPHPTIEDRTAWEGLPPSVRQAHLVKAEQHLGYDYPSLPATLFLQYARIGNRTNYEKPHFLRRGVLETLVTAECMEGKGRFLDDIVNGVWAICEETYWGVPAHIRVQRAGNTLPDVTEPTVDLFAAETSNLLAWVYYLLGERLDTVSPLVRERIAYEIDRRILTPLLERNDFHWMGFRLRADQRRVNNWNPWICSNWLATTLIMEADETRRVQMVDKILESLDHFIDPYPEDGGCDEGPSYWGRAGASLFDNLDLLHRASDGQIDVYDEPKVQEIGRFVYRAHIADDYYINFADAPALVYPDGMLVYAYGQRIHDPAMMQHGLWLIDRQHLRVGGYSGASYRRPVNFQRLLRGLFLLNELPEASPGPPQLRDVWLPVIQVMAARDQAGTSAGFFVAAKGGHNNESHNHNDVGNVIVYLDGKPLLVDAGVETYTAKTFSPERYTIWTMQSGYHTLLPTVDGVMQAPGFAFHAEDVQYAADDAGVQFSLDIAAAYPPEAKIDRWTRTVRYERGEGVEIRDAYALTEPAQEIVVSVVTPCGVNLQDPGVVRLEERAILDGRVSAAGRLFYDPDVFTAALEEIPLT
ncbi:MAG: heparinase, partial [Caldilineae bacterium]